LPWRRVYYVWGTWPINIGQHSSGAIVITRLADQFNWKHLTSLTFDPPAGFIFLDTEYTDKKHG